MAFVQLKDSNGNDIYPRFLHDIGETWITIDGSIPIGGEPYLGQNVSKAKYPDLWNWVMSDSRRYETSEANWNAHAHDGDNYKFAKVDENTLKMPRITHWLKANDMPGWINESLPNIKGNFRAQEGSTSAVPVASGPFTVKAKGYVDSGYSEDNGYATGFEFDASKSNPIYKDNAHVQPNSNTVLIGCYAFGIVNNAGSLDASKLANDIASIQSGNYEFPLINAKKINIQDAKIGQVFGTNGRTLLPNGLMLQWGQVDPNGTSGGHWQPIQFPLNFAENPKVWRSIEWNVSDSNNTFGYIKKDSLTKSGFIISQWYTMTIHWFAIGKATL